MTAVGVTGATGRMGGEVLAALGDRSDLTTAFAVSRHEGEVSGTRVHDDEDLPSLLASQNPAVLVDFTVPDATERYAMACADAGVPLVTGTTGFDEAGRATLETASESVALLKAANFAPGVHALDRAVRAAVRALADYDVELTETHHRGKRDAPSGTAKTLLGAVDEARAAADGDRDRLDRVHGREGRHRREPDEVGVHVRRAGDVRGEHEVLLADNDEVVRLTHRAESRAVFAAGALDAARWLAGREPGWYDFGAVL